jgi:hypothetical protein
MGEYPFAFDKRRLKPLYKKFAALNPMMGCIGINILVKNVLYL